MTVPRRVDRQAAQIAEAAMRLPGLLPAAYALYADKVRWGYPTGGSGRGGSELHADPTAGAALDPLNGFRAEDNPGRPSRDDELGMLELLERRITTHHIGITGLVDYLDGLRKLAPDIARATWQASRCVDPTCELVAVRAKRCWHHYRELLAERREADAEEVCIHCDGSGLKARRVG